MLHCKISRNQQPAQRYNNNEQDNKRTAYGVFKFQVSGFKFQVSGFRFQV
jgi:hypothetical protein